MDKGDHPNHMCFIVVDYHVRNGHILIECVTTPNNEHVYIPMDYVYCILPIIFHGDYSIPIVDRETFDWWMDNQHMYQHLSKYERLKIIFDNSSAIKSMYDNGLFFNNQFSWFKQTVQNYSYDNVDV